METATISTNKTSNVLITTTTNHVTSKPNIVPVSLSEKIQEIRNFLLFSSSVGFTHFGITIRLIHRHNDWLNHIRDQLRYKTRACCSGTPCRHVLEQGNPMSTSKSNTQLANFNFPAKTQLYSLWIYWRCNFNMRIFNENAAFPVRKLFSKHQHFVINIEQLSGRRRHPTTSKM